MTIKTGLLKIVVKQDMGVQTLHKRIHELDFGAVTFVLVADEKTEYLQDGSDTPNIIEWDLQNNSHIFNGNDYDMIAENFVLMGSMTEKEWEEPLTQIV